MSVVTKFPTSNAAYSGGGFTDPNNLHADDGAYGTSSPAKNAGKGNAYSAFGFDGDIPSGSTINSVKIIYEFKVSTTASIAVQRVKARVATVEEENHDNTNEPLTDTIVTVDITADRAWTRDNLLDANFEVIAEARRGNNNTAYTASWDYVKVEVDYTAPAATPTRGRVSAMGLEVPFVPTRGRLSVAGLEVPLVPTRGRISVAGLEVPLVPTRGRISAAALEVPGLPTRGRISAMGLEVPLVPTRGRFSATGLELPSVPTRGRVSAMAFQVPFIPTRGQVSAMGLEVPEYSGGAGYTKLGLGIGIGV